MNKSYAVPIALRTRMTVLLSLKTVVLINPQRPKKMLGEPDTPVFIYFYFFS